MIDPLFHSDVIFARQKLCKPIRKRWEGKEGQRGEERGGEREGHEGRREGKIKQWREKCAGGGSVEGLVMSIELGFPLLRPHSLTS